MTKKSTKIDLAKLLRKGGYNLPIEESEVDDFERNVEELKGAKPADWGDPVAILNRDRVIRVELGPFSEDTEGAKHLSMAARDGKEISKETRKKMNDDRNGANGNE